jgi:purine-cytosine permease-like protein
MAEEQGIHRREMEKQEITANIKGQTRGQYLAFVLAFIVSVGGIFLLATGHGVEGLVALLTPLAGLVGLFLIARSRAKKEAESSKASRKPPVEPTQTPTGRREHASRSDSGSESTFP